MYKICLLTTTAFSCDIEVGSDGSGAGGPAASTKSWLNGETRNGLQLCGQWPTVWVTSYRGLRWPEVWESCASALYTVIWIGRGSVQKSC